jgi:hypothetical protein
MHKPLLPNAFIFYYLTQLTVQGHLQLEAMVD